jgi:nitroreductase
LTKASKTFGAPLVLIVCGDRREGWIRSYDERIGLDIDVSIVTTHMMLMATELGLGTVWIGNFKKEIIAEEFFLPAEVGPICVLAIGYSDQEPLSPERHTEKRKPLEQTVFYETM